MWITRITGYLIQTICQLKNACKLVVVGCLIFTSCQSSFGADQPDTMDDIKATTPAITQATAPMDNMSSLITPEYVVIQASDQATFSSETVASVAAITFKEGSTFKAGDVLIQLDCRVQNADLAKAKAQQDEATMAFNSAKKLKTYGSISDFENQQAKTQMELANADVDKLSAIVEKCTITAPFKGAVAKLMVHVHEAVKAGDPLIKIVSIDNLDFVLQIPSLWLEWLHVGTRFQVHINELDKNVYVKVYKINPEIDSVSQTVKILGKEDDMHIDPALLPGMSGQATFPDKPTQPTKNVK